MVAEEPSYEPYVPSARGESPSEVRLEPGPRHVPLPLLLGVGALGPIGVFVLLMVAISPMALWILFPWTIPLAAGLGALAIGARCWLRCRSRGHVLRWGEVARVTGVERSGSATTYTNVPMRRGRGWDVRWRSYTGPGAVSTVSFAVGAAEGVLRLRGAPYDGAIVLADPRNPRRALCLSQVAVGVRPDEAGRLPRSLTLGEWAVTALTWLSLLALVVVAVGGLALLV